MLDRMLVVKSLRIFQVIIRSQIFPLIVKALFSNLQIEATKFVLASELLEG